jgi:kumamolisin
MTRPDKRLITRRILFAIFLISLSAATAPNSFAGDPYSAYIKNNPDGSQTLKGHVPLAVRNSTAVLLSHASLNIDARVIMPLANQSKLSALLEDLYDPQSPSFRHFLTPPQFAQQFAPPATDSIQVRRFLENEGLSVTGQSPNGTILNVTGPSELFERAFGVHINNYRNNDGKNVLCPRRRPDDSCSFSGQAFSNRRLGQLSQV